MPTVAPAMMSQTTLPSPGTPDPAAPQQSLVERQRSPLMWQPFAGWQTFTPVTPYGAQRRLQHEPQSAHTTPSTPPLQLLGPVGGAPHVPNVAPLAMLHVPLQQLLALVQTSPVWTQNDELSEQRPPEQSFEQQVALVVHALPAVLHVVLSGVHFPPAQVPLQQSPFAVHAALSDVQIVAPHLPPVHESAQHSVAVVHAVFAAPHTPTDAEHAFVVPSHVPEQHSVPLAHDLPNTPQPGPPSPPSPPLPSSPPSATSAVLLPPHACPNAPSVPSREPRTT